MISPLRSMPRLRTADDEAEDVDFGACYELATADHRDGHRDLPVQG
jgi:hypothetical protein